MHRSPQHRGRFLVLSLATTTCLCLTATGRADLAVPERSVSPVPDLADGDRARESHPLALRVETDDASPTHRIVIPADVLANLAGIPVPADGIASASTTRSVAAGLALSAAVGCGFVAYRRGRAARLAALGIVGLSLAGAAWACLISPVHADALPPDDRLRPPPRRELIDVVTLRQGDTVIVEVAEAGGDTIVFVAGRKPARADEP